MRDFEVRRMFDTIAEGYDMQNSMLSLRIDVLWRKKLARLIPADRPVTVVDVAAGTAEVAMEIARQRPRASIVGVDFTPAMLKVGLLKLKKRGLGHRIRMAAGDARRLPLPDACADVATISFGIRNVQERDQALSEFFRILKPGGRLYVMEFSLPDNSVLRFLYKLYFDHVLPPFGNWLSRTDYAYSYLMESVYAFPGPEEFSAELRRAGFTQVGQTPLTGGVARIHAGAKP
ncbi:bifunctional demethylmenaquinone methyltransferase/2-methoxy-6-polyprenyl-1,4-benzoquinol methylase UbiE [Fundidesulfovibrio terrae]|uniref:bifunctional demethylmenaquinone methyltransferase/2-methoxy-6-polyprenyl-1,4-benzoquinol methylase UbiE n=1 Tax=Fundidesulfovibrio terrae TaxID=2922866 RepID=UPI001FAEF2FD|nr:bifunctional demethylmenaquinone methyltransferase/2-methoxy-6-polyprenyl-1,4-benzoquinol methylase UbiE [Fundidesulfovibrio terrae]